MEAINSFFIMIEMHVLGGTIPVQTSTSHEFKTGGPSVLNPQIVDRANDFHVHASWQTSGPFFGVLDPTMNWEAEALFEQMGPGEFAGGPFTATTPVVQNGGLQSYALRIVMPAGSVPEGVYRVILRLRLGSGKTTSICGFDDLGLTEFYN